ncbi:hypothetical protein WG66_013327, partial [Moniliophthora roreri]
RLALPSRLQFSSFQLKASISDSHWAPLFLESFPPEVLTLVTVVLHNCKSLRAMDWLKIHIRLLLKSLPDGRNGTGGEIAICSARYGTKRVTLERFRKN